jgi:DNA gyrase subunit B
MVRTLLLTFFFRHMRELVEKGRLYIAQPPLFKVATKKGHSYVPTDAALRSLLTELGVQSLTVTDTKTQKTWRGAALEQLCKDLVELEALVGELAPGWARVPVREVLASFDGARVPAYWAWASGKDHFFGTVGEYENFLELRKAGLGAGQELRVWDSPERDFARDEAHVVSCHLANVDVMARVLAGLEKKGLVYRGGATWEVTGGKEPRVCTSPLELAVAVRELAQSDIDLQRYKGLGEMNPDQLWESTMDPAQRTLYQVRLEDAIAADQIFTILMSDSVEERRQYIERHALEATNLDV